MLHPPYSRVHSSEPYVPLLLHEGLVNPITLQSRGELMPHARSSVRPPFTAPATSVCGRKPLLQENESHDVVAVQDQDPRPAVDIGPPSHSHAAPQPPMLRKRLKKARSGNAPAVMVRVLEPDVD
ncbi:uncharacterized protein FIBRA_01794 [Fibroporia radiculosa]|uniref:Uncharacterized protein n=1 Tax=Fibroporia radiculosa TaxID=599839 RepID=J4HTW6_9APHY|nr:uncharacterized protein FIBRA_01794 [Fibroporia radiculosa]CCL99772.1 predicted protein [Fibroporia radiculosa]